MASGPLLVAGNAEAPEPPNPDAQPPAEQPQMNLPPSFRRHSLAFRSSKHKSSSSDEDDADEFSAELKEMRNRRFSMDLRRARLHQSRPDGRQGVLARTIAGLHATQPAGRLSTSANESRRVAPIHRIPPRVPIAVASRNRLLNIRRESDCSMDQEVAHEKLVKTSQQVSLGFQDFCLDERVMEERKRAKSLAEPISIFTNAFLPLSSTPSPTRANVDAQKQCYSPKTQTVVRSSIPYSPSPSPTPASPNRSRIMRSMSPDRRPASVQATLHGHRQRFGDGERLGELLNLRRSVGQEAVHGPPTECRLAVGPRLVECAERGVGDERVEFQRSSSPLSVCSNSSSICLNFPKSRLAAVDPCASSSNGPPFVFRGLGRHVRGRAGALRAERELLTAWSSRAQTPLDEQMNEEIVESSLSGPSSQNSPAPSVRVRHRLSDKEKDLGGNSAKASSGINACGTKAQETAGVRDSEKWFFKDTMAAGDRENDNVLVDILVHNSAEAVEFLIEKGVNLGEVNLCGGHTVPRTHWLPVPKEGKPLPVGVAIIRALKQHLLDFQKEHPDRLEIKTESTVLGVTSWNEYLTGVRYHNSTGFIHELNGKAVVLTTGGFSADRDNATSLLQQHAPHLLHLPTTNGGFATGDGVKMASAMGAALVGMKDVQVHPTAFIDPKQPDAQTKFLAAEALRGKGAIVVNERGRRFANELGRRDFFTKKINENCAKDPKAGDLPVAFMLLNDAVADGFGRPSFNFYANIKGFFEKFENVHSLAAAYKFDEETLKTTIEVHNQFHEKAKKAKEAKEEKPKDEFGKTVFPEPFDLNAPIYVARITPALHFTMGGLKIDRNAAVFSEFMNHPFKGSPRCGRGHEAACHDRLAGNSLLECVVFGRIAGRSAAELNYHEKEEL
ncbi:FAD-binding-2 domain-containing protein [Aphelenchoides fujianensis]|nr:FAD-binding-2 domain-containing protein [Aphelenchoides fujianensis]